MNVAISPVPYTHSCRVLRQPYIFIFYIKICKTSEPHICSRRRWASVVSTLIMLCAGQLGFSISCTGKSIFYSQNSRPSQEPTAPPILWVIIIIGIQPLGPVWAETRAQSGDWYGSGRLHPGQILRGSLPLISPILWVPAFKIKIKLFVF
jgi:hypothetical protein